MKKVWIPLPVLCLLVGLVLVGCESPLAPAPDEAAVVDEAVAGKNGNPVVGSVTGVDIATYTDSPRLFFNSTLNAKLHADGSATGHGVSRNRSNSPFCSPPRGCTLQYRSVCASFSADGMEAWVVAEVTRSDWPPPVFVVGDLVGVRVRDNGEGANAPPDANSSYFLLKFLPPPLDTASGWCDGQPAFPLVPQTRGQIQVRAPGS